MLAQLGIQKYIEGADIGALQAGFVRRMIAYTYVEKAMQRNARRAAASSCIRVRELRPRLRAAPIAPGSQ